MEKLLVSYSTDKGLISRIYKELKKKLNRKRTSNPVNKWANELNRQFSEEEIQMTNKHILIHRGNANQHYTKIPSYPSQISNHQENKQQQMLVRTLGKGPSYTVCW
jgi:hypothetical protein